MYDVAIIGGGPAGISAAINLKILQKNFVWFSTGASEKVIKAERIQNYPGLPDVTGEQLNWALLNHACGMGITPREGVVSAIYDLGGKFSLTVGEEQLEARAIILCTGVKSFKDLAGEGDFLGRGVSYCATCDGLFYRGREIAVISYDKHFENEVEFLSGLAKKTYFLPQYALTNSVEGAETVLDKPLKIEGGERVERLVLSKGALKVDGVFILRNFMPPEQLLHGLSIDGGAIVIDRAMRTNIAGVFAAGDCTGRPYQYAKSVGEGNIAAHSAVEYLAKLR